MGLRFRHRFQLFPGVHLNFSAHGVSASFGVPGATVNVGRHGMRATAGLPGTGLSYSSMLRSGRQQRPPGAPRESEGWPGASSSEYVPIPAVPVEPGKQPYRTVEGMREIGSKGVEVLTSTSLVELRDMLMVARKQSAEVESDLSEATAELGRLKKELAKRSRSLFRYFYRKRIEALREAEVPQVRSEIERLSAWKENTRVEMTFQTTDAAQRAYASLVRAFDALRSCGAAWDVTADRDTNQFVERTTATRAVDRHLVRLEFAGNDLVRFEGRAMSFENVNGEDILIYPGVVVMPRADGMFALIDLRELKVSYYPMKFVEAERPPGDAEVVGYTWAKANKDGSPDRRFRDNYQIPICVYGHLTFSSASGVTEEYQVSQPAAAEAFANAVWAYQAALMEAS